MVEIKRQWFFLRMAFWGFLSMIKEFFSKKSSENDADVFEAEIFQLNLSSRHLDKIKTFFLAHQEKGFACIIMQAKELIDVNWLSRFRYKIEDPKTDAGIFYRLKEIVYVGNLSYTLILIVDKKYACSSQELGEELCFTVIPPEITVPCRTYSLAH